jgi:hypothetical protein
MNGKPLYVIDSNNPKDILFEGLKMKTDSLGDLRVPFDITTEYPSRETYEHDLESRVMRRRIVIKKMQNTVRSYAIGNNVAGHRETSNNNSYDYGIQGHLDLFTMEISVWSPDSSDRDNLVELIKLWMLELEQDLQAGEIALPFFYSRDLLAIRFLRAYEDINREIYRNGPIYIGSLVFEVLIPFFHATQEELERYTYRLRARVLECFNSPMEDF